MGKETNDFDDVVRSHENVFKDILTDEEEFQKSIEVEGTTLKETSKVLE